MKKILNDTPKTKEFLNKLPKIYLIVKYVGIAILDFPFTGEYIEKDIRGNGIKEKVPLVYDWDDCNGTCDNWFLRPITSTTGGWILGWSEDRETAEKIKLKYEINNLK